MLFVASSRSMRSSALRQLDQQATAQSTIVVTSL
jgi:hypothetical protein